MRRINVFKRNALALGVTSAIALSSAAFAEVSEKYEINIASQQLGQAMRALAKDAGVQIIMPSELGDTFKAPSLKGEYSLSQALDLLMKGSGLKYEFLGDDSVVIKAASDEDDEGAEEVDEEVVVTGTRLKNVPSGSNVVTLTRDDIDRRGFNSLEDVLRSLPQNFNNNTVATSIEADGTQLASEAGQSAANLRGLGSSNTLVLVNGRRWPGSISFSDGTANLNGIPFSAVKQVNILLDGASAVYGADALGGVIDVILHDDYVGLEVGVRHEEGRNGSDDTSFDITGGFGWDSGNVTFSLSHSETGTADLFKAGATTNDLRSLGGSDFRFGVEDIGSFLLTGQPGVVYGLDNALQGCLNTYSSFIPAFFADIAEVEDFCVNTLGIDPNDVGLGQVIGALPLGDPGTNGLAGLDPANIVPADGPAQRLARVNDTERDSLYLRLDQDITDSIQAFAEIAWADSQNRLSVSAPSSIFADFLVPRFYAVSADNPYNDYIDPNTGLPSDVLVAYSFYEETRNGSLGSIDESNQETLSYTLGFTADLSDDWNMELSATRSEESAIYARANYDTDLLQQRIYGLDENGAPLPIDQIINVFGDGSANSAEVFDGIFLGTVKTSLNDIIPKVEDVSRQDQYLLTVDGTLFDMPAGEVGVVFGYEYRDENLDRDIQDPFLAAEDLKQELNAYFAEVGIPLVGEANSLPGVASLDLRLAARKDDYKVDEFGASYAHTSPKVDLIWGVTDEIKVRATWGESFKAPTLRDLFRTADTRLFNSTFFTLVVPGTENTIGPQGTFLRTSGGNPNLQPEISTNTSIGFDWTPSGFLDGFGLSVTAGEIDVEDRIGSTSLLLLNVDPEVRQQMFLVPGAVEVDENNLITRVVNSALNFGADTTEYVDFQARYLFETGLGDFEASLAGTYTANSEAIFVPETDPIFRNGTSSGPDNMVASGGLSWNRDNITASWFVNYSSSYDFENRSGGQQQRVEHYVTHDLTGSYAMDDQGLLFRLSVRNITNQHFPFINKSSFWWDNRRVDDRGRLIALDITKTFDI